MYVVHKEEKPETRARKAEKKKLGFNIFKKKEKEEPQKAESKEKEAEYGLVEVRSVKLGYMTQDLVEIEKGLEEDELIVTEIQEEIKDKAKIEISEVKEGLF